MTDPKDAAPVEAGTDTTQADDRTENATPSLEDAAPVHNVGETQDKEDTANGA